MSTTVTVFQQRTLPPPLTPLERLVLDKLRCYNGVIRDLGGTGKLSLFLNVKDGEVLSISGGVEGPREEVG